MCAAHARSSGTRRPVVTVARVYAAGEGSGYRVLVDRLWPRGVSKDRLRLDEWAKDAAPSTTLRRWYGHEPSKFHEFARRYHVELSSPPAADVVARLATIAHDRDVVLLTATRDVERSGAQVLHDHLVRRRR